MRAAVIETFGEPLAIKSVPDPEPGYGEILVKLDASGICNGDLFAQSGHYPGIAKPTLPRIPGHRGAGIVQATGKGVTRVAVGDRVGVPLVHHSCSHCSDCFEGQHQMCDDLQLTGYQEDGCYAEYVKARADFVGRIPDGLPTDQAAHLTCTGVTAWGALSDAKVKAGQWCAVWGLGAVGQYMLRYAKGFGLRVVAISGHDDALEIAEQGGADLLINSRGGNPVKQIKQATDGGVHTAICNNADSVEPFRGSFDILRQRGTLVVIGLPLAEMPIPLFVMAVKQIVVRGSFVGSRSDLEAAYDMALRNNISVPTEELPLEDVNHAFDLIRQGKSTSRILLRP